MIQQVQAVQQLVEGAGRLDEEESHLAIANDLVLTGKPAMRYMPQFVCKHQHVVQAARLQLS